MSKHAECTETYCPEKHDTSSLIRYLQISEVLRSVLVVKDLCPRATQDRLYPREKIQNQTEKGLVAKARRTNTCKDRQG